MQFQFVWLAARLKLLNSFAFLGLNHPFRSHSDSCTYLRAYTQHCSQLLLVTIVCFTSSQKHLAFYAKCLRRDQEKESCQLHEKFNILHAHTHTHTNIHMNCFKMKLTFLMRHLAWSRLLYDCSFNDHDSWNGKPGTSWVSYAEVILSEDVMLRPFHVAKQVQSCRSTLRQMTTIECQLSHLFDDPDKSTLRQRWIVVFMEHKDPKEFKPNMRLYLA